MPADAVNLLRYIRDTLHCRVALAGETATIRPVHRCPPRVVVAVLAVLPAVRGILKTETGAGGVMAAAGVAVERRRQAGTGRRVLALRLVVTTESTGENGGAGSVTLAGGLTRANGSEAGGGGMLANAGIAEGVTLPGGTAAAAAVDLSKPNIGDGAAGAALGLGAPENAEACCDPVALVFGAAVAAALRG